MKISYTLEIKATPDKVFYWLEYPHRAKEWMTSVTKFEIISENPNKVGTTFREYIEEDGRGTEMRGVITDFVSNKRLAFHLEGDFNTVDVDFTLKEHKGITQLTQNAKVNFKGIFRLLNLIFSYNVKRKIMRQIQSEFARLKVLCENDVQ